MHTLFIKCSLLQIILFIPAFCSSPLFLEHEIHAALLSRDSYYRQAGVIELLFPCSLNNSARLNSIQAKNRSFFADNPDASSEPWFYFLEGLGVSEHSQDSMNLLFGKALNAASDDPGITWILAGELGRIGFTQWEQAGLSNLHKFMLSRGSDESFIISQSLLTKARLAKKNGREALAAAYASFSSEFGPRRAGPMLQKIAFAFPLHPRTLLKESARLFGVLTHSWELQLSCSLNIFLWMRSTMTFLIIGLFLVIGVKYASTAFHWLIELFPATISMKWRTYFSLTLFISFISFGILPFLWLLASFVWSHCNKRDKWIVGVGCILLILYPLSIRLEDMLRQCLSPDGSVVLFKKAISEGNYPELDRFIRKAALARPGDPLALTAAALVALKGDDIESSRLFAGQSRLLCHDDPAAAITEGAVLFCSGEIDKARAVYESLCQMPSAPLQAYFNCGQCRLAVGDAIKGMEYLDRAAKMDPIAVNGFIAENDALFLKKWPKFRQVMLPDYTPGYFWLRIFPRYGGNWTTTDAFWGASCLGIPVQWYCMITPFFLIALLLSRYLFRSTAGAIKTFRCKLCQTPACRRCKKGAICDRCFQQLHQIRNENIRQRIIEKILLKGRKTRLIIASCLDVLFPGTGMLYFTTGAPAAALLFMTIAASSYGALYYLHGMPVACSFDEIRDSIALASLTLPLLNVAFALRAALIIARKFRL